jgi:hypothetical protein
LTVSLLPAINFCWRRWQQGITRCPGILSIPWNLKPTINWSPVTTTPAMKQLHLQQYQLAWTSKQTLREKYYLSVNSNPKASHST